MNTRIFFGSLLLAALSNAYAQPPNITQQPTNQSVSLGASAKFQVSATSTSPPIRYQWRFATADIAAQTNSALNLTNIQVINSGDYSALLTDGSGSVTSQVAHLEVDPNFTKITAGAIVNSGGYGFGCAWGDYDDDGFIDLFVCNWNNGTHDFLYHNRRDGTFERITSAPQVSVDTLTTGAAWGDYDNDGKLDLFVTRLENDTGFGPNTLYHNEGNGKFTKITKSFLVTPQSSSHAGIWADFDNDGFLDLVTVNFTPGIENYSYHNTGDGNFGAVSLGPKAAGNGHSWDVAAADFNNDGWIDLFVPQGGGVSPESGLLYLNNRNGGLALQTGSVMFTNLAYSIACAWGDYDNDGFLDLFVTRLFEGHNSLYHNNGDGTFTLVINSAPAFDEGNSTGCTWADYDNDGWLDLFVANVGPFDPKTLASIAPGTNFLYHNNGDGTFTKVTTGSLVNDLGFSIGAAWADYDNDGFPDLFVSNGWITKSENNFLYHNNGNTNNWINFKLVGTVSNRAAIGAKVRVRATIAGKTFWQMREISGGGGHGCQNDLRANFGFGDATNVDLVWIEWPSGIVQELTDVATKQFLTIYEPSRLLAGLTNGVGHFSLRGGRGLQYQIEASPNLMARSPVVTLTITNLGGTGQIVDPNAANSAHRFYRARQVGP